MRKVLSIQGHALQGFAEPQKKSYQIDYHSEANTLLIQDYIAKNQKAISKWQQDDMHLPQLFPVTYPLDSRIHHEDVLAIHEWMYNTRILDIVHNAGKPHIEVKLPQYISLRTNWIIALNTLIQALDGGIEETICTLTKVLNNEEMWQNMNQSDAIDRERLLMIRYFMWQLLKAK